MGLIDRIGLKITGSKLKGRLRAWVPLLAGAGFVAGAALKSRVGSSNPIS